MYTSLICLHLLYIEYSIRHTNTFFFSFFFPLRVQVCSSPVAASHFASGLPYRRVCPVSLSYAGVNRYLDGEW